MRQLLSTALVALIVGGLAGVSAGAVAQTGQTPAGPAAVSTINADRIDGRHAVSATASKAARAGKLVATDAQGYLPSNIVRASGITAISITGTFGSTVSVAAGASGTPSATCPSGSKAIGGGFSQSGWDIKVTDSYRLGPGSWQALGWNQGSTAQDLAAYVICMSVQPDGAFTVTSRGKNRVAKH
jgi:hypothetical protein